jgi:cell wall-associated NlpC family hydrolase
MTAALVLAVGLVPATLAKAEPDVTDDDVAAAQEAVTSTAAQVAAVELRLAEQAAARDAAWVAVATAAETYTQALVDADAAEATAASTAERAATADADVEEARAELGQIALEAHRAGGSLDDVAVLLSADGYEDFVARSTAIDQMGERADRAVQRFQAAEVVGRTLAERAERAAEAATAAATAAEDALSEAQRLQAVAEGQVAQIEAERDGLLTELAQLRQTSVEVERARQAQVEADRAARADAAARPPTSGDSGTTTPVSAPSTPTPAEPTSPPATAPPTTPPPSSDPYGLGTGSQRGTAAQGDAAVAWAVQQVGKTYAYGASGPDSFDCSGLTMRAWEAAGVRINRTSRDQYRQVYKISYDSMRPGDLIFWGTNAADPGSIYHVAMYVGDGQMVEASRPGVPLRVTPIRWSSTMPYAGRP